MTVPLSLVLSVVGGFVDTVGFLALQGLFTAHITGNFVTIGAALIQGRSGVIAKLLALPVFCLAVVLTRLASHFLAQRGRAVLRRLLWVQATLLALGAVLAVRLLPIASPDSAGAILTGMSLVAAMAVQNAAHRVHFASSPPSTLMTGTTTQIMIDIADLLYDTENPSARLRIRRMVIAVFVFAGGCAAGAMLFAAAGGWAFAVPALVILVMACAEDAGKIESAK